MRTQKAIDAIAESFPSERYSVDSLVLEKVSRDRFELSPILAETLPVTHAKIVVWPRSTADVETIVRIAYDHGVPITPRGMGTGNYGQAVPFESGILIDFSKFTTIFEVTSNSIRAGAGAKIFMLERAANKEGLELGIIPSTVGSTIGGFLSGGSGGAGSIENGWIWDGFAQETTVVPCVSGATAFTSRHPDNRPFLHAYGTTGIVSEVEVLLQPHQKRVGIFATFPSTEAATTAGLELMALTPAPRLVSIDSPEVSDILSARDPNFVAATTNLRLLIGTEVQKRSTEIIEAHGGNVAQELEDASATLLSLSFNHVTERVLDSVDNYIHLQASGPGMPEIKSRVESALPEMAIHFDGFQINGVLNYVGLIFLSRPERVEDIDDISSTLAEHGVIVNNPHKWGLSRNLELYREAASIHDPSGLLNPGKLK